MEMPRNDIDYGSRPISFRACKTRLREVASRLRPRSKSLLGRKDIRNKEQKTMNKGGKKPSRHTRQTRCPSQATSALWPMTCLRCKDNRAVTGRRVFRDIGRVGCGYRRSDLVVPVVFGARPATVAPCQVSIMSLLLPLSLPALILRG